MRHLCIHKLSHSQIGQVCFQDSTAKKNSNTRNFWKTLLKKMFTVSLRMILVSQHFFAEFKHRRTYHYYKKNLPRTEYEFQIDNHCPVHLNSNYIISKKMWFRILTNICQTDTRPMPTWETEEQILHYFHDAGVISNMFRFRKY